MNKSIPQTAQKSRATNKPDLHVAKGDADRQACRLALMTAIQRGKSEQEKGYARAALMNDIGGELAGEHKSGRMNFGELTEVLAGVLVTGTTLRNPVMYYDVNTHRPELDHDIILGGYDQGNGIYEGGKLIQAGELTDGKIATIRAALDLFAPAAQFNANDLYAALQEVSHGERYALDCNAFTRKMEYLRNAIALGKLVPDATVFHHVCELLGLPDDELTGGDLPASLLWFLGSIYYKQTFRGKIEDYQAGAWAINLILTGAQGTGKTQFSTAISYGNRKTITTVSDFNNTDVKIQAASAWLVDAEELAGSTSKTIQGALKAQVTTGMYTVRFPYERSNVDLIKRSTHIGSTNLKTFLFDTTGDRRTIVWKVQNGRTMSPAEGRKFGRLVHQFMYNRDADGFTGTDKIWAAFLQYGVQWTNGDDTSSKPETDGRGGVQLVFTMDTMTPEQEERQAELVKEHTLGNVLVDAVNEAIAEAFGADPFGKISSYVSTKEMYKLIQDKAFQDDPSFKVRKSDMKELMLEIGYNIKHTNKGDVFTRGK